MASELVPPSVRVLEALHRSAATSDFSLALIRMGSYKAGNGCISKKDGHPSGEG